MQCVSPHICQFRIDSTRTVALMCIQHDNLQRCLSPATRTVSMTLYEGSTGSLVATSRHINHALLARSMRATALPAQRYLSSRCASTTRDQVQGFPPATCTVSVCNYGAPHQSCSAQSAGMRAAALPVQRYCLGLMCIRHAQSAAMSLSSYSHYLNVRQ